jgi:hypothetical protein
VHHLNRCKVFLLLNRQKTKQLCIISIACSPVDALGRDALLFEGFTFDHCGGHVAPGPNIYHYHTTPGDRAPGSHNETRNEDFALCPEVAPLVGGSGTGHSPVFGIFYDGIPIYGPRVRIAYLEARRCHRKRSILPAWTISTTARSEAWVSVFWWPCFCLVFIVFSNGSSLLSVPLFPFCSPNISSLIHR